MVPKTGTSDEAAVGMVFFTKLSCMNNIVLHLLRYVRYKVQCIWNPSKYTFILSVGIYYRGTETAHIILIIYIYIYQQIPLQVLKAKSDETSVPDVCHSDCEPGYSLASFTRREIEREREIYIYICSLGGCFKIGVPFFTLKGHIWGPKRAPRFETYPYNTTCTSI